LHGTNRELVEEIIRLSKDHGILTEYTSFLVDLDVNAPRLPAAMGMPGMPAGRARVLAKDNRGLAEDAAKQVEGLRRQEAHGSAGGGSGVSQSVNRKAGKDAAQAPAQSGNVILNEKGDKVQLGGLKNVSQRSFVQNGAQWVDVGYKDTHKLVKVKAFSPAYFQLANAHPRMAQYLSVSNDVVIVIKDMAVHVSKDGRENEFTAAEFKDIKTKMDGEFGVPPAPTGNAKRTAMAAPSSIPRLAMLLILPLAAVVGLLLRKEYQS
jgi:hypothetical protein